MYRVAAYEITRHGSDDEHHLQVGPDCWIRTGEDLDDAVDAGLAGDAQP